MGTLIQMRDHAPRQEIRFAHKLRAADCEEVDCPVFLNGHDFYETDESITPAARRVTPAVEMPDGSRRYYFHHPAGAQCGARCPNAFCGCSKGGDYPHHVVNDEVPMGFWVDRRRTSDSHAFDAMAQGVDTYTQIVTRGL